MYVRTNARTHARAQIHRSATITRQEINGQAHKSEKAHVDMLTEGNLIAIESDGESNKGNGEALANEEKSDSEEEEQDINGAYCAFYVCVCLCVSVDALMCFK